MTLLGRFSQSFATRNEWRSNADTDSTRPSQHASLTRPARPDKGCTDHFLIKNAGALPGEPFLSALDGSPGPIHIPGRQK